MAGSADARIGRQRAAPFTTIKLSLRMPPTLDAQAGDGVGQACSGGGSALRRDGRVRQREDGQSGWHAPALAPWLEDGSVAGHRRRLSASRRLHGRGRLDPLHGMLGEKFPDTQFVITGVLGPHSNAHGPNEFLHIPTGKR